MVECLWHNPFILVRSKLNYMRVSRRKQGNCNRRKCFCNHFLHHSKNSKNSDEKASFQISRQSITSQNKSATFCICIAYRKLHSWRYNTKPPCTIYMSYIYIIYIYDSRKHQKTRCLLMFSGGKANLIFDWSNSSDIITEKVTVKLFYFVNFQ